MTNINRSRARRVLGGLALAAGTAAAYGTTATGADVIPNNEDEMQSTSRASHLSATACTSLRSTDQLRLS